MKKRATLYMMGEWSDGDDDNWKLLVEINDTFIKSMKKEYLHVKIILLKFNIEEFLE